MSKRALLLVGDQKKYVNLNFAFLCGHDFRTDVYTMLSTRILGHLGLLLRNHTFWHNFLALSGS